MSHAPSPLERYHADLKNPDFQKDPAQARAVDALQAIYQELIDTPPSRLRRRGCRCAGCIYGAASAAAKPI